jgi:hypothetical protein
MIEPKNDRAKAIEWMDCFEEALNNNDMALINQLYDENRESLDIDWAYDVEPSLSQRYDTLMDRHYNLYY